MPGKTGFITMTLRLKSRAPTAGPRRTEAGSFANLAYRSHSCRSGTSISAKMFAHCAPCISRSSRVPWIVGLGTDILTTSRSAMSNRLSCATGVASLRAIYASFRCCAICSKRADEPQKMSIVSQKGPAFLDLTLSAICPNSGMDHLMRLQAEHVHRVV